MVFAPRDFSRVECGYVKMILLPFPFVLPFLKLYLDQSFSTITCFRDNWPLLRTAAFSYASFPLETYKLSMPRTRKRTLQELCCISVYNWKSIVRNLSMCMCMCVCDDEFESRLRDSGNANREYIRPWKKGSIVFKGKKKKYIERKKKRRKGTQDDRKIMVITCLS